MAGLGRQCGKPVFVKLPPYHTPEDQARGMTMVDVCIGAGIDGVSMNGGRHVVEPRLAVGRGSLAGRDTFPDALRIVGDVAERAAGRLVIRASGGVFTGADAARMLRAGATTVEVYTAFIFRGWRIAGLINRSLLEILDREGVGTVTQLRGQRERDRSGSPR